MISEISSILSTIKNSTDLIDRLRKKKKDVSSDVPKKDKYCSLSIEHAFPHSNFKDLSQHKIELILCKKGSFSVPIRHIDWVIFSYKLDKTKPVNASLPKLWTIPATACLLTFEIDPIFHSEFTNGRWSDKYLRKAVKSMCLQCSYADGYKQRLPVPDSLKLAVFLKHHKSKSLFAWNEFLLLNT